MGSVLDFSIAQTQATRKRRGVEYSCDAPSAQIHIFPGIRREHWREGVSKRIHSIFSKHRSELAGKPDSDPDS
ncbi:hypothetical protein [Flexibacterium corallicola]|uniref:hypothetical protein n=1 Tax=Flexibacterium corallicola TaxID=3037259 RepID=UPI00286F6204|nr:hypothetical protein [Pseudovibrio sp. M1P-2-3]